MSQEPKDKKDSDNPALDDLLSVVDEMHNDTGDAELREEHEKNKKLEEATAETETVEEEKPEVDVLEELMNQMNEEFGANSEKSSADSEQAQSQMPEPEILETDYQDLSGAFEAGKNEAIEEAGEKIQEQEQGDELEQLIDAQTEENVTNAIKDYNNKSRLMWDAYQRDPKQYVVARENFYQALDELNRVEESLKDHPNRDALLESIQEAHDNHGKAGELAAEEKAQKDHEAVVRISENVTAAIADFNRYGALAVEAHRESADGDKAKIEKLEAAKQNLDNAWGRLEAVRISLKAHDLVAKIPDLIAKIPDLIAKIDDAVIKVKEDIRKVKDELNSKLPLNEQVNIAIADFKKATEALQTLILSKQEASIQHELAMREYNHLLQKLENFKTNPDIQKDPELMAAITKTLLGSANVLENAYAGKKVPVQPVSAKLSGQLEAKHYIEKIVKEVLGDKYLIPPTDPTGDIFVRDKEKPNKPQFSISVQQNHLKAHVNFNGKPELTDKFLQTAQRMYGNNIIFYSLDPEEKKYVQGRAEKLGITLEEISSSKEFDEIAAKAKLPVEAKPDAPKPEPGDAPKPEPGSAPEAPKPPPAPPLPPEDDALDKGPQKLIT